MYLLLYVDNMLIAAKSMSQVNLLKKQLGQEFKMKDLGATKKILGWKLYGIEVLGNLCYLCGLMLKKILQRFNIANAKPVSIPLASYFVCRALSEDR